MLPTRSASGRRFMAGVVGGGQVLDVAGFGVVTVVPFTLRGSLVVPSDVDFFPRGATRFSFSASRLLAVSTVGAPSRNWNDLSFVRVWVDGIMGGPVTTCLAGGAAWLLWWGKGGPFCGRRHWPLNCC
jgi:hypothetical protein